MVRHLFQIEVPNTMLTPYLYESQGIEIALNNSEIDTVFWDAAAPGMPTEVSTDCSRKMLLNLSLPQAIISSANQTKGYSII